MENAIAVKERASGLAPMTLYDLALVGKAFESSGMFGCKQEGQGLVLAMSCHMAGMTPIEFIETYHILDGKPTMRADTMLANLLKLGGKYEVIIRDASRACIKASFRDATTTVTLTWDDAKQEPFVYKGDGKTLKTNWATPRARMQMLWARVTSDAVRTVCPLANKGCYTPEEIMDLRSDDSQPAPAEQRKHVAPQAITIPAETVTTPPAQKPSDAAPVIIQPEVIPPAPVDCTVMPIGKQAGKKWTDFGDASLAKALLLPRDQYPELTDGHIAAIQAEIERRKAAQ